MKMILLILALINTTYAGTCTSISRSNYSANSVLTSSALNSDFNTVYNNANDYDGGCITDGTLEFTALNSSDFAPMLYGIQQGCKVTFSSVSELNIGKCIASVNGNFIRTTSNTSVSMGCGSCSGEAASTTYYAYIATGSSGTTINPLILTTAPNEDGYDNSGNKVVAKFYNNATSSIDEYSIDQWLVNRFVPTDSEWQTYTPTTQGFGTLASVNMEWKRDGSNVLIRGRFQAGTTTGDEAQIGLPNSLIVGGNISVGHHVGTYMRGASGAAHGGAVIATKDDTFLNISNNGVFGNASVNSLTPAAGTSALGSSEIISIFASVPVYGWAD